MEELKIKYMYNKNSQNIKDKDVSLNESQLFNLNLSMVSKSSKITPNKDDDNKSDNKVNLMHKFRNVKKLEYLLQNFCASSNIILLVDSNNNIWELVRRYDIKYTYLKDNAINVKSIINVGVKNYQNMNNEESFIEVDRMLNLKIKDDDFNRTITSEMNLSKLTDFDISMVD